MIDARSDAAWSAMDAICAIARIAHDERLGRDERLHYLRVIRHNLTGKEDRLSGLDALPPCIGEKFADAAHDHYRHT